MWGDLDVPAMAAQLCERVSESGEQSGRAARQIPVHSHTKSAMRSASHPSFGPLLAAIALAAATARPSLAQVSPADSAAFVAITQQLMDAITNGDSSVWAPHLSPRWFITDEEGQHVPRTEFLAGLRGLPAGQRGQLKVTRWHLVGGPQVAVLSYDIDEWHDFYGQELRTRFHATDTWVREDGAWKMLASQMTALPTPIPGRRVARRLLVQYEGRYALTPEIVLRVAVRDSGLVLIRSNGTPEPLYALDDRIFIRHGVRGFWVFERNEQGAVTQLVNWRDNNAVVWRRLPTQ